MLEKGKEIENWCDPAMFKAQPIEQNSGPTVTLLSATPDPLGTIAAVAKAYKGEFPTDTAQITDEERRHYLADVRRNVLAAPLEFVHFHFLISGVTRSFTHQLVRQRTATYAQESMRFAVKDPLPVGLPPSLDGTVPWHDWQDKCREELYPGGYPNDNADVAIVSKRATDVVDYAFKTASQAQKWRATWDHAIESVEQAYNDLINAGMPAEDARGLAPHATLTQVNYTTDLRHLIDHAGLRLCSQAQTEWRAVWRGIISAIRAYGPKQGYSRTNVDGTYGNGSATWQFDAIAGLFKPICMKTGKCEFMSAGDRYCQVRERVNAGKWDEINWEDEVLNNPLAAIAPENRRAKRD